MAVPALALGVLALAVAASGAAGSVKRAGGIAYVTKSFERDAGYAKLKAGCPRDTHVLSGGEDNNASFNAARLHHSYPIDGRDKRKKPDDGWGVALTSTGDYTFRVYAICADRKVKYVKRSLAANAMAQTEPTHLLSRELARDRRRSPGQQEPNPEQRLRLPALLSTSGPSSSTTT